MNPFEALCKLASDEKWCWHLHCTTCGHIYFRYAFCELARGRSPEDAIWHLHDSGIPSYKLLGPVPEHYSRGEKEKVLSICRDADIYSIAESCRFPDWLGFLVLVLAHMNNWSESYRLLSVSWASQLIDLVPACSNVHAKLCEIVYNEDLLLKVEDLKACTMHIENRNLID